MCFYYVIYHYNVHLQEIAAKAAEIVELRQGVRHRNTTIYTLQEESRQQKIQAAKKEHVSNNKVRF